MTKQVETKEKLNANQRKGNGYQRLGTQRKGLSWSDPNLLM